MSMDPMSGANRQNPIQQNVEAQDAEEIKKARQEYENNEFRESSIGRAEEASTPSHLEPSNPQLPPPDGDLVAEQTHTSNLQKEDLTDQVILDELTKYPQFKQLLDAQSFLSQDNIIDHARQVMLNNSNDNLDLAALAGKALSDKISEAASLEGSIALKEMANDLKAELLFENHPTAKILAESIKNDFIAEGKSPEEAEKLAMQKAVDMIQSKFDGNIASASPKIDKAIATLLAAELGGTEEARNFVANLTEIVGMEGALMAAFDKMAAVQSDEGVENVSFAKYQDMIGSSQELVEAAMAQIDKLPIPGDQKTAILEFMKTISAALAELEEVMAEIEMADLMRAKDEMKGEIERIKIELKSKLKEIQKTLKKIKKAKKKGGIFGKFGDMGKVLGPIVLALTVIAFVSLAIVIIAISIITAPVGGIFVGIILLSLLLVTFAVVITALSVSMADKADKMFDTFMAAGEGIGLSEAATAGIIAGIVLVIAIIFPFLGAPLLLIIGPEMLARSGAFEMAAQEIGSKVGMDETQIMEFEGALRTIGFLIATSGGMIGSHTYFEVSKEDQERLLSQVSVSSDKRNADSAFSRVDAYSNIGQTRTLNQAARTSPEALKERREEMQKMIAMLTKIIAQLKELMAALMSGDPGAINAAIEGMQTLADEGMSGFTLRSDSELAIEPMVGAGTEAMTAALPAFLPSARTLEQQYAETLRARDDLFEEEHEDIIRPNELMG
jgi:hypothetical protein